MLWQSWLREKAPFILHFIFTILQFYSTELGKGFRYVREKLYIYCLILLQRQKVCAVL